MLTHRIYYFLKPFIPRSLQIMLRRQAVLRKRELYRHIWPIDDKADKPPEGWMGWPEGEKFALVLMHDVDTEKGHRKCYELMGLEESMGFRSSFNFVPERYDVSPNLRRDLVKRGFEVAVHGLKHDGKLFLSRNGFREQAIRINNYLKEWGSSGFVSPSMIRNLDWMHELAIKYDSSTFDTDPFEPQPDGVRTIFPFWVQNGSKSKGFVELPYTLPQDFTLFVLMQERNIDIWEEKLDWIVAKKGLALLVTHPDYMSFGARPKLDEYPVEYYVKFLRNIKSKYDGQFFHVLPKDIASFWAKTFQSKHGAKNK
jgi:hypothetical protein